MTIEDTDLERRVLAHERILQVLIAHMAEAEPKFLDRLKDTFTKHHTLGADEHDFTGTEQYAERFIREVEILDEAHASSAVLVGEPAGERPAVLVTNPAAQHGGG